MSQARRRIGRLFYLLLVLGLAVSSVQAATPGTSMIADVVYRADGTPAGGTLVISWPAFTAADGSAVAAGTKSVSLAVGGVLSVDLIPNAGETPARTYYTVVFQLDDPL